MVSLLFATSLSLLQKYLTDERRTMGGLVKASDQSKRGVLPGATVNTKNLATNSK